MVKNIIPKLGMFFSDSFNYTIALFFCSLLVSSHVMSLVFLLSFVSGRAGYQPSPAADGAIQLGDGLGGNAVALQPCVPAGQKLFFKVVAGQ